jgi:hypothetical protein
VQLAHNMDWRRTNTLGLLKGCDLFVEIAEKVGISPFRRCSKSQLGKLTGRA